MTRCNSRHGTPDNGQRRIEPFGSPTLSCVPEQELIAAKFPVRGPFGDLGGGLIWQRKGIPHNRQSGRVLPPRRKEHDGLSPFLRVLRVTDLKRAANLSEDVEIDGHDGFGPFFAASVLISRSINSCIQAEAFRFPSAALRSTNALWFALNRIVKGFFGSSMSFNRLHCLTSSVIPDGMKCQGERT